MFKTILKHIASGLLILGFIFNLGCGLYYHNDLIYVVLSSFGWWVALGFFLFYCQHFQGMKDNFAIKELYLKDREVKLLKYHERLKELSKLINDQAQHLNGYSEQFSENFGIYKLMLDGKGVSVPVANTVIDFALSIEPDDTIFLVKVNSDQNVWHMKIGGKPIHYVWARETLYMVANQCDKVASPDYIIWKPEEILN